METCPSCGYKIQPGWNYCPACAAPLIPSAPAYVEFIGGPEDGRRVPLAHIAMTIGRRSDQAIAIYTDRTVSREHAVISFKEPHFWVVDLKSKLGTRVNGERIDAPQALDDGAMIAVGHTRLLFCLGKEA
ncbi:MAG: zinc-ribbon and FHA domain-containing protein [Anaerolineae bacterium]|nr:zinc-ribbon and FHA domain-containing protein [Anaerolineae bacterium]